MKSYIIEGGRKLDGEINVSGSKNASLPILASTILSSGNNRIYNVPNIQDTKITLEILKILGCKVTKNNDKIEINSKYINKTEIPQDLMHQMRSTVILAGALLGRFNHVTFTYPGGCDIGARPIELHLKSFKKLGVIVEEKSGYIECRCKKIVGADINLDFPSVGATENILLATVLSEGITTISNAAMEPEIIDLAKCLNKMGANITGAGTNFITVKGVEKLKGIGYNVMPDRIEAGTLLCAAAITGGKILLNKVNPDHLNPAIHKLEECGCIVETELEKIKLTAPKKLKAIEIKTLPHPGFPTDLQQVFGSMLCVAKGSSIVVENIFENRYKYISELKKMGAKATIEGKTLIINGVKKLYGADVISTDLRGGASLILAGLVAKGRTNVTNIEYILRGYEKLDDKLRKLGANIKYIEK